MKPDRRLFLRSAAAGAGLILIGCTGRAGNGKPESEETQRKEAEVTPGEDLMQEHGVLERVLLIYEEAGRRIGSGAAFDVSVVAGAADVVRTFVEEYHEQLEERFVFPRLQAARSEPELVEILLRQHRRGREVTEEIRRLAGQGRATPDLGRRLAAFSRMYRPHAAREDTVLFPALRRVAGGAAYRELGEQFEDEEHRRFGEEGFERIVAEVAGLEERLGLARLADFTA